MINIGEKIKALRISRGYTLEELAKKLGYKSLTTISKWETGIAEPPLNVIYRLTDIFMVDINTILKEPVKDIKEAKEIHMSVAKSRKLNYKKIREHMNKLNIGNKELSERSKVLLRTINNIISGTTISPSVNNIIAIAHTLKCDIEDFIDDDEGYKPYTTTSNNEDWTQEELYEIEQFKQFIRYKRNN